MHVQLEAIDSHVLKYVSFAAKTHMYSIGQLSGICTVRNTMLLITVEENI